MLIFHFRFSCDLVGWLTIAKSQALEIVHRSRDAAVEGVVGDGKIVRWRGVQSKGEGCYYDIDKKTFLRSYILKLCLKQKRNINEFFLDTSMFWLEKLRYEIMG